MNHLSEGWLSMIKTLSLENLSYIADESMPANKVCGLYELPERFQEKFKWAAGCLLKNELSNI